ncbi:MAG: thioredoxin family protein [Gemmatimonadota bacterium]
MTSLHLLDGVSDGARQLDSARWHAAPTLAQYIEAPIKNQDLWRTTTRLARLDANAEARAGAIDGPIRLLVLLEDWCGDAMYTVPFIQRVADANPQLELRVLPRDANDDLMRTHCTGGARSIPVAMAFDATGTERAWWGARPSPLQAWVLAEGLAMEKPERYKRVRTWYARDRGATTVHEILTMLESITSVAPALRGAAQVSPVANPA